MSEEMNLLAARYNSRGFIESYLSATELSINSAIEAGDPLVIVDFIVEDSYVVDGKVVSMGARPSDAHTFDYEMRDWVYDLAKQRENRAALIDQARELHELSSFEWNGYMVPTSEKHQRLIIAALQLASNGIGVPQIALADDSGDEAVFVAEQCIEIGLALCAHINDSYARARILKNEIYSAKTQSEVEAVSW
jgi:hypothetical protein